MVVAWNMELEGKVSFFYHLLGLIPKDEWLSKIKLMVGRGRFAMVQH